MRENTKRLLTLIAIKGGDTGILAQAILELEAELEEVWSI